MESIILLVFFVGIFYWISSPLRERTNSLKIEYEKALASGDKARALKLGREYYSSIRGGFQLTIYDEQAISNDLASMDNKNRK